MKGRRLIRGKPRESAVFPVAPGKSALPVEYASLLQEVKDKVLQTRLRTVLAANAALVMLYWEIGHSIAQRQGSEGWGARVVDRLAHDLRAAFPDMKGFSPTNLKYMRRFAEQCPARAFGQQPADQLPWFHIVVLITRLPGDSAREWYATRAIQHGWSRSILELQIDSRAHRRQGKAVSNFAVTLPPPDSDMATQVFKDPYLFDFLGTADPRREREVEQALVDHIQKFLLELGAGFAFVGRQVHLEVDDRDYYLDLLFYHLKLRRYVVVELKAVPFDPAFVGTLNVYLSAVDDLLRHRGDKPTIGLLLCRSKRRLVVEYALRDLKKPIGVAEWETKITRALPKELASSLPTIEQIEAELQSELDRDHEGKA